VAGDAAHRSNVVTSIYLSEPELEARNLLLIDKYARIADAEQRADLFGCDDADVLLVACNTPARMAKGAVSELRARGVKAGLFRPITIWPFPVRALAPLLRRAQRIVVVEASHGQLEDELRLALSHADLAVPAIDHVRRYGGMLPSQHEIVTAVLERPRAVSKEREAFSRANT
jgi:pyruvate/2-oxoacid:ferredoxin oxidoreductase alpha subunit